MAALLLRGRGQLTICWALSSCPATCIGCSNRGSSGSSSLKPGKTLLTPRQRILSTASTASQPPRVTRCLGGREAFWQRGPSDHWAAQSRGTGAQPLLYIDGNPVKAGLLVLGPEEWPFSSACVSTPTWTGTGPAIASPSDPGVRRGRTLWPHVSNVRGSAARERRARRMARFQRPGEHGTSTTRRSAPAAAKSPMRRALPRSGRIALNGVQRWGCFTIPDRSRTLHLRLRRRSPETGQRASKLMVPG